MRNAGGINVLSEVGGRAIGRVVLCEVGAYAVAGNEGVGIRIPEKRACSCDWCRLKHPACAAGVFKQSACAGEGIKVPSGIKRNGNRLESAGNPHAGGNDGYRVIGKVKFVYFAVVCFGEIKLVVGLVESDGRAPMRVSGKRG